MTISLEGERITERVGLMSDCFFATLYLGIIYIVLQLEELVLLDYFRVFALSDIHTVKTLKHLYFKMDKRPFNIKTKT